MPQDRYSGSHSQIMHRIRTAFLDNFLELKILISYSGPLIMTNLLDYLPFIITTIFCGHLGKMELDAIVLTNSFVTMTGHSVGLGLNAACDTLISQMYGGKNLKMIGVVVQRGILILILTCFPCWALFVNTKNILVLLGQNRELARLTEWCVIVNIPFLPATCFYQLQLHFLQNQGIMLPQMTISLIASIINAILNYILLFVLKTGVIGSAVSLSIAVIAQCILLFVYICLKKLHVDTWPGWSVECLKDWGSFLALGIPCMMLICIDWWAYEVAIFLSGLINLVELGAYSILYQLMCLIHEIAFGVGTAASIRVGTFLGAGETEKARKSANLSFLISGFVTLLIIILMLGLRFVIAKIFTNDREITDLVAKTMLICALYVLFESPSCIYIGLLRGIGKPHVGAVIFTIGYCILTFPIGVPLMFTVKLGMKGFWIGATICFVFIDLFFFVYFWRLNWQHVTDQAQERVGLQLQAEKKLESFEDNRIDVPDNVRLKNYAALDSASYETEQDDNPSSEPSKEKDDQSVKRLIIRRVLESLAVVSTFLIGLIIRLTVNDL